MQNDVLGLNESQAGMKIAGRNINNFRYADDTTPMAETVEDLKSFLMRMNEESIKPGLKLNIQKTKIMASSPIISWQIHGEKKKQWQILFSWATESLWMVRAALKLRHLLLRRKVMANLDSILGNRHFTSLTKVHIFKTIVFPIVIYGCENWTIRKSECQRIDGFELLCLKRLLSVPWTAKRSNQSILKEIKTEYSLEGLTLKFQHFGHLMWRANSLEKAVKFGKIEGKMTRGWKKMRWLVIFTESMDMNLSKL